MKRVLAAQPLAILLAVWGLVVIVTIAASPQPTLANDEYAYWAMSFKDLYGINPTTYDPYLPAVGVEAYHRIIALLRTYFTDSVTALRIIQILLYAICVFVIARSIFPRDTAGWWRWGCALLLASPFALYVSPVMPESWFFCAAGLAIIALAKDTGSKWSPAWAATAGILAVQSIFFKPHAMALIAGLGVATLVTSALPKEQRLVRIGLNFGAYVLGCVASVFLGFLLWQTTSLIAPFYQSYAKNGADGLSLLGIVQHIVAFTVAGVVISGPAVFVPIAAAISSRKMSLLDSISGRVWIASLAVMGAAIVLAAAFTVKAATIDPGEALRVHARYFAFYAMIAGLASLAFVLANVADIGALALRISIGIYAAVFGAFVFWVLSSFRIFPWDNPWMVSFIPANYTHWSSWRPPFDMSLLLIVVLFIAIGAALVFPRRLNVAHVAFLAIFNIAAAVATLWFVNMLRDENRQLFNEVRAFSDLTASSSLPNEGVIVLDDRYGRGAVALWALQEPARVVVLPAGATLTPAQIPSDAPWVIMTQKYDVQIPYAQEIRGQRSSLLLKQGARPRVLSATP